MSHKVVTKQLGEDVVRWAMQDDPVVRRRSRKVALFVGTFLGRPLSDQEKKVRKSVTAGKHGTPVFAASTTSPARLPTNLPRKFDATDIATYRENPIVPHYGGPMCYPTEAERNRDKRAGGKSLQREMVWAVRQS